MSENITLTDGSTDFPTVFTAPMTTTNFNIVPHINLRSIVDIIKDLSKPINERRLKTRKEQRTNKKTNKQFEIEFDYLPWTEAVKILDHFAPGWSYEVRNVYEIGNQIGVVVRITIPSLEGLVYREGSAMQESKSAGWGNALSNCEVSALKKAALKFGLGIDLKENN